MLVNRRVLLYSQMKFLLTRDAISKMALAAGSWMTTDGDSTTPTVLRLHNITFIPKNPAPDHLSLILVSVAS